MRPVPSDVKSVIDYKDENSFRYRWERISKSFSARKKTFIRLKNSTLAVMPFILCLLIVTRISG